MEQKLSEKTVNFNRSRRLRCGSCHHEWLATPEWLERFAEGDEGCPSCHTDCKHEDRPDYCSDPKDPALSDATVRRTYWYHSSTHTDWPNRNHDPTAHLTEDTRARIAMGSRTGALERWAKRQKTKALHVGTYEAAIENMLRRMQNQAGPNDQFYLYRVQLDPDCVIEPGVHPEPTNFDGDVHLADISAPGTTVLRYINVHEDPSSISLAIELSAIHAVQTIQIPLPIDPTNPWILDATTRLKKAASTPHPPAKNRWLKEASPITEELRQLETDIATHLPLPLRHRMRGRHDETTLRTAPATVAQKLAGLTNLVTHPHTVLDALDSQPWQPTTPIPQDNSHAPGQP